MDGVMHVELPQDVAAQVRSIARIIKKPAWKIVVEAIEARYGEPCQDPDDEFADLFQDHDEEGERPCPSSS